MKKKNKIKSEEEINKKIRQQGGEKKILVLREDGRFLTMQLPLSLWLYM